MNYYDPKVEADSQKYQCLNLDNLLCGRFYCDSEDLDLENHISIFEGTPVLCDSELIGFVSKGIHYVDHTKIRSRNTTSNQRSAFTQRG